MADEGAQRMSGLPAYNLDLYALRMVAQNIRLLGIASCMHTLPAIASILKQTGIRGRLSKLWYACRHNTRGSTRNPVEEWTGVV